MARNDHFSGFASTYAAHRPTYPDELFAWLASQAPSTAHAWDCATGTGQAAVSLAKYFDRVTATDVGAGMIEHAAPHPHVTYRVGPAEDAPVDDHSVALVTVAQALHWFDLPAFWATCARVAVPGAVLAYWGYMLPKVTPVVDAHVEIYHEITTGPYWPLDRQPLLEGYANVNAPGEPIPAPQFVMRARWTVEDLIGLLDSWSATHRARKATGVDPLAPAIQPLRDAWGDVAERDVTWPLILHVRRL